jgi:putative two-component system response regulator
MTIRILLLEDNINDEELVERILSKDSLDFEARRVENREGFIRALNDSRPDIILSDINLPSFSGFEALEIARKDFPDIPFIFVSGMVGEDLAIRMFKQGASDCINKNHLASLPNAVRRALDEANQRRQRHEAVTALAESYRKTHDILIASIKAMATAMEFRDPYTAGHQRRAADLAVAIAKKMEQPENETEGVYLSAIAHDIGKIYVPAEILMRPTALTKVEYQMIQVHSKAGYEILKDIDFPWPIAEAVYQHHERMDGSGYPRGMRGDDIIMEARIIAVADIVEAMASHRPYRAALGVEKALDEIRKASGKTFDPYVVEACTELFSQGFVFQ